MAGPGLLQPAFQLWIHSQPLRRAIRAASTRLPASSLWIASER